MTHRELLHFRIGVIVGENPQGITAAAMFEEMRRRGWAYGDQVLSDCGLAPGDLIRLPPRRLDA
jgi:hypothetical protein